MKMRQCKLKFKHIFLCNFLIKNIKKKKKKKKSPCKLYSPGFLNKLLYSIRLKPFTVINGHENDTLVYAKLLKSLLINLPAT